MRSITKQKYHDFFVALKNLAGKDQSAARTLVNEMQVNTNAILALKKSGIIKFDLRTGAMSWVSETPIGSNVEHLYGLINHYCASKRDTDKGAQVFKAESDDNIPDRGVVNASAPKSEEIFGALSLVPRDILMWIKAHAQGPEIKVEHESIIAALKVSYPQAFDKSIDLSSVKVSNLGTALSDGSRTYVGVVRRGDMKYHNKAFTLNARFRWRIEESSDNILYLIPEQK